MKLVRKGPQNFKHIIGECFWCKKEMQTRYDVHKRQMAKYGHLCCKRCFGNEKSFKDAQKARTDSRSHPHSEAMKVYFSAIKMGNIPWNKGLDITDDRVKKYAAGVQKTKRENPAKGDKNPNWKGGISKAPKKFPNSKLFKKWMKFRDGIIKRDFGQCYKCNERFFSHHLDVHHLNSRTRYPEYEFDEQNCVLLCEKCHKKFHAEFGVKNFTPAQFVSFINRDRDRSNYFKFD